nr:hypothetical protein [Tanacetum cinerariifolium]
MVLSLLAQMPPTSKPSTPPTIEESMAKLADSIDKLELVMKCFVASTVNLVSVTTKATTVVSTITKTKSSDHTTINFQHPTTTEITFTMAQAITVLDPFTNPVNKSLKLQHDMVISHPTNLYDQTYHLPIPAKDKFTLRQAWFSPSPFIALCFCILKTIC